MTKKWYEAAQKYTLGILFNLTYEKVLLLNKQRPEWQKGLYNFPGGKFEKGETAMQCMVREFKEETHLTVAQWQPLGNILSVDRNYIVHIFTCRGIPHMGKALFGQEQGGWFSAADLPPNVVPNVRWLTPFAYEVLNHGPFDQLQFGGFTYGD